MTRPESPPAPARVAIAAPPARPVDVELELTDDELDRVVGGLERVFLFGPGAAARPEPPSR